MKIFKFLSILFIWLVCGLALSSCGGGGSDEGGGDEWSASDGVVSLSANLYDARALFTVEGSDSVLGSESVLLARPTISDQSPLMAVTSSGLQNVLIAFTPDITDALDDLPRLSYVAVSPIGDVILAFESKWDLVYTDTVDGVSVDDYDDPYSASSPFTCQLFRVSKRIDEITAADVTDPPALECITNELELNTWDFRSSMIQFDDAGNSYFTAHVPNNWKNVLVKWDATTHALTEVINANICFRDYMITGAGGVLYTGITSTSGDCDGDSFLRYLTPDTELQEITRGWWDYTFAPVEEGLSVGQIIFYGPDPDVATTPDWDDSGLFRFNPEAEPDERNTLLADNDVDIWQYLNEAEGADGEHDRCIETKNMLGGGNQPEKILFAELDGDETDIEVFIVGNVSSKRAGTWKCNLCVEQANAGPCTDADGEVTDHTTQGACVAAGNTWQTNSNCYNDITSALCTNDALPDDWNLTHNWCEQPGEDWEETHAALARVNGDANRTVDILSDTELEVVSNGWTVDDRIAYCAYDVNEDSFKLVEASLDGDENTVLTELLDGIEVYELFEDPRDSTKWFINGLRFSDNAYIMGSFDPDADDPSSTLSVESGITGQIETLVIVPEL